MAHQVRCHFLLRRSGFNPRSGHVICGWESDTGSEYYGFLCQFTFHRLLHTHHHPSSGNCTIWQIVAAVPSGLSSPPPPSFQRKLRGNEVLHFILQHNMRHAQENNEDFSPYCSAFTLQQCITKCRNCMPDLQQYASIWHKCLTFSRLQKFRLWSCGCSTVCSKRYLLKDKDVIVVREKGGRKIKVLKDKGK
jgi:hypothetical protein